MKIKVSLRSLAARTLLFFTLFSAAPALNGGFRTGPAGPSLYFAADAAELPAKLSGVGISEHLGEPVGIGKLRFRDEAGKDVALADYVRRGKPVLLTLVYYQCPNLCNMMLNGLVKGLKNLEWIPGNQFEIVSVSIDPSEKPDLAAQKKTAYLNEYGHPEAAPGWHFLTGDPAPIQELARQTGFQYRYDETSHQFAHASALVLLTPEGKISRYLYGIDFPEKNLRLGLLEASSGKIGTMVDRVLLFCFHYDPNANGYSVSAFKITRVVLSAFALGLLAFLGRFWRRQFRAPAPQT